MKFINISKTALLTSSALMMLSLNASAATQNFGVGFTTVPDITLTPVTALDLGTGIFLPSGSKCDIGVTSDTVAAGVAYPGDVNMKIARGTVVNEGAKYQVLGGAAANASDDCAGAGTATGTAGFYEITAVPGGSVKVNVTNVTGGTFFNFAVTGCVANYNGAGNGDSCTAVTPGTPITIRVADNGDTVGNTGTFGAIASGKSLIALGGTLTTIATHTSNTDMTENMTITVTY